VVIRNKKGEYLTVLENKNAHGDVGWWLPCGHVESNEDFFGCG
jgi:ADP-ribose pyrophosphatase YjhB (NUDIX family)